MVRRNKVSTAQLPLIGFTSPALEPEHPSRHRLSQVVHVCAGVFPLRSRSWKVTGCLQSPCKRGYSVIWEQFRPSLNRSPHARG